MMPHQIIHSALRDLCCDRLILIQPGDGGWGVFLSGNAFAKVFKNTYAYASGLYLSNPREFNGVRTVIGDLPAFTGGDKGVTL